MDPLRFQPMTGVPTPPIPGRAAAPAQTGSAAPQDQVQLGTTGKSSLLDKAKTLSLISAGGITAAGLLEAAGAVTLATGIATVGGLAVLVATGMAAVHFGKKMFGKGQVQQQADPNKSKLLEGAKNVAMGGAAGLTLAGCLEAAGVVGLTTAVGAASGVAVVVAAGMGAVYLAKKFWSKKQQGQQAPPQQAPPQQAPPQQPAVGGVPTPPVIGTAPGVPPPPAGMTMTSVPVPPGFPRG